MADVIVTKGHFRFYVIGETLKGTDALVVHFATDKRGTVRPHIGFNQEHRADIVSFLKGLGLEVEEY